MNVKLHTPKSLAAGSGMSSFKQFLMSIVATSISILLTFGTAYFVDKNKKEKERREMVMMIMYDMQETQKQIEDNDSLLNSFIGIQTDIVANPETFDDRKMELQLSMPFVQFNSTTENIFRSNIETVNTISNIAFVDNVSTFYDLRKNYKELVFDRFGREVDTKLSCCDSLATFDAVEFCHFNFVSYYAMLRCFEVCKLQMNVTEEELQTTSLENEKLKKALEDVVPIELLNQKMEELSKLRDKFGKAVREGKEKQQQKKE